MNILLRLIDRLPGRRLLLVVTTTSIILLAGCTGAPERPSEPSASVPWPEFALLQPGETRYLVDTEASELRIRVDPEGPMARLGHSHVIGGRAISGTVILGEGQTRARIDLDIDATALDVDKPQWRAAEGLKPALDPDAISGTRANMRSERVLHVSAHPRISIRSLSVNGPTWLPDLTVRVRLRGEIREIVVPVAVERTDRKLIATGAMEVLQSDFGIEPFSAAGGALRVSDRMRIRFRIVAVMQPQR